MLFTINQVPITKYYNSYQATKQNNPDQSIKPVVSITEYNKLSDEYKQFKDNKPYISYNKEGKQVFEECFIVYSILDRV